MIEISTCDIETDPKTFKFLMIGLFNRNKNISEIFYNLDNFFEYCFENLSGKYDTIFAHYGGGFDFLYFMQYAKNNKIKVEKFLEISGRIILLRLNNGKKSINFRDSYALLNCSLEKAASEMLNKHKIDIDFDNFEKYTLTEISDRCIVDCELLYDCLIEFRKEMKSDLKVTTSQQALDDFTKNHLGHKLIKNNVATLDYFQKFYFGGHVDVYKRYGENLYLYDIVNCYGAAMHEFGAPVGLPRIVEKRNDKMAGFYQVVIKDMDFYAPPFPKRLMINKQEKLYFLNSNQVFNLTSLDLNLLDCYSIEYKILNGIEFAHDEDFFKSYISYWYDKRFKSEKLKFISKLMINSLYGKFGQKYKRLTTLIREDNQQDFFYDNEIGLARKEISQVSWFMQYHIAAWITSAARNLLHYYLIKYQDNLYYCDTDSLFLNRKIDKDDLTEKKELGKLDLQDEIKKAYFISSKFYRYESYHEGIITTKLKGFEDKNLDEKFFQEALENRLGDYKTHQRKLAKFKTALISGDNFIKIQEVEKTIKEISLKRKLCKNNISTEPYYFNGRKLL